MLDRRFYFRIGTFEYYIFRWTHFHIGINHWEDLTFHVGFIFFSIYLSFKNRFLPEFESKVSFHDGCLYIIPYGRMNEWRSSDPWWRKGLTFCVGDWILGKPAYSEENLINEHGVVVPMPEGCYRAKARLFKSSWKRRFYTKSLTRVDINCEAGIPVEGKGENSWDCGMDATYSLTCPADNIEEGIGHFVGSVLRSRARRGGPFPIPVKVI